MIEQLFLREQFELYEKHIGSWKPAHREAMGVRDLEDVIAYALTWLGRLRRHAGEWARTVEAAAAEFTWEQADDFASWYRRWLNLADGLLEAVRECEEQNYQVEGADRLRVEHRDVSLMCLDTEEVRTSIVSLEEGQGVPAKQAMDELRDRLRPGGS